MKITIILIIEDLYLIKIWSRRKYLYINHGKRHEGVKIVYM